VELVHEKLIVPQLVKKFIFVKPKNSLPCSQERATSSYPKPDESRHTLPFCLRTILISYFHDA